VKESGISDQGRLGVGAADVYLDVEVCDVNYGWGYG
jgi:hypothetical protein